MKSNQQTEGGEGQATKGGRNVLEGQQGGNAKRKNNRGSHPPRAITTHCRRGSTPSHRLHGHPSLAPDRDHVAPPTTTASTRRRGGSCTPSAPPPHTHPRTGPSNPHARHTRHRWRSPSAERHARSLLPLKQPTHLRPAKHGRCAHRTHLPLLSTTSTETACRRKTK